MIEDEGEISFRDYGRLRACFDVAGAHSTVGLRKAAIPAVYDFVAVLRRPKIGRGILTNAYDRIASNLDALLDQVGMGFAQAIVAANA